MPETPDRRPSKRSPAAAGGWLARLSADAAARPASGADGRRAIIVAYVALALIILAIDTVNVLSVVHDTARIGQPLPVWQPMVWEYSSGLTVVGLSTIGWFALKIAPPESGRWLRVIAIHLIAATGFSVLHVAIMVGLRMAIYAAVGLGYYWAPGDFGYEYRKDLLTYVLASGCFWVTPRVLQPPVQASVQAPAAREGATYDILDGGRTLRTPVAEIVAVQSAGNYVEFRLADGAVRLMRATLAEVEQALAPHGFVRIHRSWIANAHRLSLLEPAGSGDYRLVLDGGVEAPVSRRYPAALARLKGAAKPEA